MSESEFQYWVAELKTTIVGLFRHTDLMSKDELHEELSAFEHIAECAAKALGYKIK